MKGLFIELYLDEDVDVVVADLLCARGFAAHTTQEANQIGGADEQQLQYATEQGKTFLTHNRVHFEALIQRWFQEGRSHHGVIIASRRPPHEIVRRLLLILDEVSAEEMQNQVRYI